MRKFLKRLKKTIFHKGSKMFLCILTKTIVKIPPNRAKALDFPVKK